MAYRRPAGGPPALALALMLLVLGTGLPARAEPAEPQQPGKSQPDKSQPDKARPERPLEEARRVAERSSFTGEVLLRWRDESGMHEQRVGVQSRDGVVYLRGGRAVLARRYERLIRHDGHRWDVVWPAGLGPRSSPDAGDKYAVATSPGPVVAGHPSRLIEIRRDGTVRERLFVMTDSGLLLARNQYDEAGALVRSLAFESLTPQPSAAPPIPHPHGRASSTALARHSPGWLPAVLAPGYRRLGAYRRDGVLHAVYSDGVYGLSVFQQPGRLRRADLPAGGRSIRLGASTARRYRWAGGHVLVWQSGAMVFTAVGDGPLRELISAARALPAPPGPGVIDRLRRACRSAVPGIAFT